MKFHLRSEHDEFPHSTIPFYVFVAVLLGDIAINTPGAFVIGLCLFILFTVWYGFAVWHFVKDGIYIDGKEIKEKGFRTKNIDINDIAAIKLIPQDARGEYRGYYEMKNYKGEYLFLAIFLNAVEKEMYNYPRQARYFFGEFKKQIIASSVYEKEAIDYLCSLKPDIEIIPHYTIED